MLRDVYDRVYVYDSSVIDNIYNSVAFPSGYDSAYTRRKEKKSVDPPLCDNNAFFFFFLCANV